uniref:DHHA2 domain-containing protein n=1 Tax=Dubosiella newyorkensis TaxID=1862672 RepID=UPI0034E477FC
DWDWKLSYGGNSGMLYHVVEDPYFKVPYVTGPEYQKEKMEAYTKRSGIDLYVFALTSILENGTYFYISGPLAQQLQQNLDQTHFFPNILSRKKQIVPLITNWIQEAN